MIDIRLNEVAGEYDEHEFRFYEEDEEFIEVD